MFRRTEVRINLENKKYSLTRLEIICDTSVFGIFHLFR